MATVQDRLNTASPSDIADRFRQLPIGDILAGLIPSQATYAGLASSATHVNPVAGNITAVSVSAAAKVIVDSTVTAGAGEVQVTYDAQGVGTLVFGDGANTGYTVTLNALPAGLATILATVA